MSDAKQTRWVTLRLSESELLKRVRDDLTARYGVKFSYGQAVTMLARKYLDEKGKA